MATTFFADLADHALVARVHEKRGGLELALDISVLGFMVHFGSHPLLELSERHGKPFKIVLLSALLKATSLCGSEKAFRVFARHFSA